VLIHGADLGANFGLKLSLTDDAKLQSPPAYRTFSRSFTRPIEICLLCEIPDQEMDVVRQDYFRNN
jgi:hypothetical protein